MDMPSKQGGLHSSTFQRMRRKEKKNCQGKEERPNATPFQSEQGCKPLGKPKRYTLSRVPRVALHRTPVQNSNYSARANITMAYKLQTTCHLPVSTLDPKGEAYHSRFVSPFFYKPTSLSPQTSPCYEAHSPNLRCPSHSLRGPNSCRERIAVCVQQPNVVSRGRVRPRKHEEFPISGLVWPVARKIRLVQHRKPDQRMGRCPGTRRPHQERIQAVLFRPCAYQAYNLQTSTWEQPVNTSGTFTYGLGTVPDTDSGMIYGITTASEKGRNLIVFDPSIGDSTICCIVYA